MRAALLALLLTGCAATWHHPTKGQAEFDADLYRCDVEVSGFRDPYQFAVMRQRCMQLKGWRPI